VVTRRPVLFQAQTPGVLRSRDDRASAGYTGLPSESVGIRLLKWPARAMYRRADAIACISHVLEREAMSAGVAADRVHFLPNAVDMGRYSPPPDAERAARRQMLGLQPGAVTCVFVGRLSREKGVLDLVEAWKLVQPAAATLLVAGPDMSDHPWN